MKNLVIPTKEEKESNTEGNKDAETDLVTMYL